MRDGREMSSAIGARSAFTMTAASFNRRTKIRTDSWNLSRLRAGAGLGAIQNLPRAFSVPAESELGL
jgi:hypothetical protein